jgi:hypothetical protein
MVGIEIWNGKQLALAEIHSLDFVITMIHWATIILIVWVAWDSPSNRGNERNQGSLKISRLLALANRNHVRFHMKCPLNWIVSTQSSKTPRIKFRSIC